MVDAWARHRRQFRAVWDAVSEGLEGKEVRPAPTGSLPSLASLSLG